MTRFLSSEDFTPSKLWKLVKPTVRETESEEGVSFQLLLIKQVFKNADGTESVLLFSQQRSNKNIRTNNSTLPQTVESRRIS